MTDRLAIWLAWHLPKRLVYWCAVRVGTHEPATMTEQEFIRWEQVPDRRFIDGLQLWHK